MIKKNIRKIVFLFAILISFLAILLAASNFAYAITKTEVDAADEAATNARKTYDEAVSKQNEITAQLDETNNKINELNQTTIPAKREKLTTVLIQSYKNNLDPSSMLISIITKNDFSSLLFVSDTFERFTTQQYEALDSLKQSLNELDVAKAKLEEDKTLQDAAVETANNAKEEALSARDEAREAWKKQNTVSYYTGNKKAPTSDTAWDEASARAWIVQKESGGNYNARNGRYIGAYQLTNTYLNGDYSPENQDRVAEEYVRNRYGSWMKAVEFWKSHNWY